MSKIPSKKKQGIKILPGVAPKADEYVHLNMRYYNHDFQCLSSWTASNLKSFSDFNHKLRQMSWDQINLSGGKLGKKTGLGCTKITFKQLPENARKSISKMGLNEDLSLLELRVAERPRVFGFRRENSFFLILLDQEHSVFPF